MTIKNLFLYPPIKEKVSIKGWVKTFRANRFISVNDGSSLQSIQCVVDYENTDEVILNFAVIIEHFVGQSSFDQKTKNFQLFTLNNIPLNDGICCYFKLCW